MKNLFLTGLLFLGLSFSLSAQELDQYQYVRVPESFDFLRGQNQYQLNALTAFLFEKFGFVALYKEYDPKGVEPCEILKADVKNESVLFRTKLKVTLENCTGDIVFTSRTGVSKEKDYKISYQEALRDAFESVEALHHSFIPGPGEVIIDPVVSTEERKELEGETPAIQEDNEVIVNPVVTSEEMEEIENNGSSKEMSFVNGTVDYKLIKTPVGFDLFREGDTQKFASLVKSGGGENYLYSSKNIRGIAYFDREKNLVVEYLDNETVQLLTLIYRRKF